MRRRAPHGARGLKQRWRGHRRRVRSSRPARGAWIETTIRLGIAIALACRAPHGARGLKRAELSCDEGGRSRAPHGARGLKHRVKFWCYTMRMVAPRTGRGGWNKVCCALTPPHPRSRPARGAWIDTTFTRTNRSVSARGLKQDESGECQHGDAWPIARHCL